MLFLVIEEWNNTDFRFLALLAQKLGFLILKRKNRLAPQIKFSNLSFFVEFLTKAKSLPSFLLSSNQAYVELRIGVK